MLAMARAYKKQPGKRSILFVFHGAEERGLLGSRWHAAHPVVPKEDIVAVLNGDMIGRNDNNEAALLGGNAPHKNSEELVKMAEDANNESTKFKYLKDWDSRIMLNIFTSGATTFRMQKQVFRQCSSLVYCMTNTTLHRMNLKTSITKSCIK